MKPSVRAFITSPMEVEPFTTTVPESSMGSFEGASLCGASDTGESVGSEAGSPQAARRPRQRTSASAMARVFFIFSNSPYIYCRAGFSPCIMENIRQM